jgi:hypothetical protein
MNQQERLSEALHATLDVTRPSPDLADRIVERLTIGGRGASHLHVRPLHARLAGLAAAVAVLAVVPLVLGLRANAPSFATASPLALYDRGGLAFDYPATWKLSASLASQDDSLGSGSGPGQVMVTVRKDFLGAPWEVIDPTDPSGISAGESYVTVAGLPAIFKDSGTTLDWQLSVPGLLGYRVRIHAEFSDPGADQLRAQVEALVASVRYDPPPPVLDPVNGPSLAALAVDRERPRDPAFACFPDTIGATATATVTSLPFASLTRPLPVTCSIEIEPVPIGFWRVSLIESWTAASDRPAGSLTTTIWLYPDGTEVGLTGGLGPWASPSGIPYAK